MKKWVLEEPRKLVLSEVEPSVLQEGQIKVKIEKVLFTTSDYRVYAGESKHKYPFVLGRNAVGVVSEVSNADNSILQKMNRVAIEPYVYCGTCDECKNGKIDLCDNIEELGYNCDGLMQNFIDVMPEHIYQLPDNLPDSKALFTSYVAFCLNVVDRLNVTKGGHIAIFGTTKTALILAQLVAYYQAVPIFISNNKELLDIAQKLGIFYCFNTDEVDVADEVKVVTGGRMCKELVFFSDSDFVMKDVYNVASTNANICLAGYSTRESKLSVAQICQKHLNVFGVYNGAGNFASAINLLATNTVNVDCLIGDEIGFDNLDEGLQDVTYEQLFVKSKVINID